MLLMHAQLHHIAAQARFADLSRATSGQAAMPVERQARNPRLGRRRRQWLRLPGALRPAV